MGRDAKRRERKQGELQKRIDASCRSEYGKMQAEGANRFDGGGEIFLFEALIRLV